MSPAGEFSDRLWSIIPHDIRELVLTPPPPIEGDPTLKALDRAEREVSVPFLTDAPGKVTRTLREVIEIDCPMESMGWAFDQIPAGKGWRLEASGPRQISATQYDTTQFRLRVRRDRPPEVVAPRSMLACVRARYKAAMMEQAHAAKAVAIAEAEEAIARWEVASGKTLGSGENSPEERELRAAYEAAHDLPTPRYSGEEAQALQKLDDRVVTEH